MARAAHRPNLFIIGAPKAGTTSMHFYLGQHPRIFMSPVKEPHYFATDLMAGSPYFTSLEEYLRLFETDKSAQWFGEASTNYMFSDVAVANIARFDPTARLIAMLRNPIDLVVSHHQENRVAGHEHLPLAEALDCEAQRLGGTVPWNGRYADRLSFQYSRIALFGAQLERVLRHFRREQLHVILFDDLTVRAALEVQHVFAFLGLETEVPLDLAVRNARAEVRRDGLNRLANTALPPALKGLKQIVPAALRQGMRDWLRRHARAPMRAASLDPELAARIAGYYRDDVARLSTMLGIDLSARWHLGA